MTNQSDYEFLQNLLDSANRIIASETPEEFLNLRASVFKEHDRKRFRRVVETLKETDNQMYRKLFEVALRILNRGKELGVVL